MERFYADTEFTAGEKREVAEDRPEAMRRVSSVRAQLRLHQSHLKRIEKVSPTGDAAVFVRGRVVAAKEEIERLQLEVL
jgi:hypothetical protein